MSQLTPRSTQLVLFHAVIWLLLGVLVFTQPNGMQASAGNFYALQTGLFVVLLGVFYGNIAWAVPHLLYRRRLAVYAAALVAVVAVIALLHKKLERQLATVGPAPTAAHQPLPGTGRPPTQLAGPNAGAAPTRRGTGGPGGGLLSPAALLSTLLVLGLGTSVAALQRGQRESDARHALEQEKLAAELSFLKAQLHPHFLFNTLNNIYSLTLLDGEKARASIHQFSRLIRYVLYDTAGGPVHLSQEIGFLRDYVTLMHLRLTSKVQVHFDVPDPLPADPLLAPMLLQPLVENAFKHGVSATAPSVITIEVRQPAPRAVVLRVRNTAFPDRPAADADGPDEPGGIGLTNIRRRLTLLYPNAHTLTVTEHAAPPEYEICLSLLL